MGIAPLELTGLATDLPPYRYPPTVWTFGQNVQMADGFPKRADGFGAVFDAPLHLSRFHVNVQQENQSTWVYCGDKLISTYDGAHTDITGAEVFDSTGLDSPWSGGIMNRHAILNNQTNVPLFWRVGLGNVAPLNDWPSDRFARSMRVFREYLIAMDITETAVRDEQLVRWSDVAPPNSVPTSWTAGPLSLAGSVSAMFTPGPVVDGLTLRDQFMIYKAHATFVLTLIGGRFVMRQRPLFSTLGVLSKNCAVEWRGSHLVLADGDVVLHNGTEAQSLVDRRIKSTIFSNLSTQKYQNSYVVMDKENAEIWVCFVENGEDFPKRAAVWSIADNKWGIRDLGNADQAWPYGAEGVVVFSTSDEPTWSSRTTTWTTDAGFWDSAGGSAAEETLLFSSDGAGPLFQNIGDRESFDGVAPVAILSRSGLDLGVGDQYKHVSRVWPRVEAEAGTVVQVRVGGQAAADSPVIFGEFADFIVGTDESVGADSSGRYIAIEFRTETSALWSSPSFDLEVTVRGRF